MPKDFDMIIRINSERAEIEVEQHSKTGVVTRKNISPQSLSNCILTSRYDDESHPTGLLPEGCIAVVMERKFVYYFIRYPELYADFSYYETEYLEFPIPRLVFCFKYLPHEKKVVEASLCVVKDERLTPDTLTYRYPFSNVHGNLSVCLGTTPCRSTRTRPGCTPWRRTFCACLTTTISTPNRTTGSMPGSVTCWSR